MTFRRSFASRSLRSGDTFSRAKIDDRRYIKIDDGLNFSKCLHTPCQVKNLFRDDHSS